MMEDLGQIRFGKFVTMCNTICIEHFGSHLKSSKHSCGVLVDALNVANQFHDASRLLSTPYTASTLKICSDSSYQQMNSGNFTTRMHRPTNVVTSFLRYAGKASYRTQTSCAFFHTPLIRQYHRNFSKITQSEQVPEPYSQNGTNFPII